jgi:hypothetical protein
VHGSRSAAPRVARIGAVAAFLLVLSTLVTAPGATASTTWTGPFTVTSGSSGSCYVSSTPLASDSLSNAPDHTFWGGYTWNCTSGWLVHGSPSSGFTKVAFPYGSPQYLVLSIASDGSSLYILVKAKQSNGLALVKRSASGSYSRVAVLSTSAGPGTYLGRVVASNGKWWAMWMQRNPAGNREEVWYAHTLLGGSGSTGRLITASASSEVFTFGFDYHPGVPLRIAYSMHSLTGGTTTATRTKTWSGTGWSVSYDVPHTSGAAVHAVAYRGSSLVVTTGAISNDAPSSRRVNVFAGSWKQYANPQVSESVDPIPLRSAVNGPITVTYLLQSGGGTASEKDYTRVAELQSNGTWAIQTLGVPGIPNALLDDHSGIAVYMTAYNGASTPSYDGTTRAYTTAP